ncbi:Arf-GAP with coiled-coil, ANK repeat and PH domain-containing protein 3, partial [Varanus komodoensis]
ALANVFKCVFFSPCRPRSCQSLAARHASKLRLALDRNPSSRQSHGKDQVAHMEPKRVGTIFLVSILSSQRPYQALCPQGRTLPNKVACNSLFLLGRSVQDLRVPTDQRSRCFGPKCPACFRLPRDQSTARADAPSLSLFPCSATIDEVETDVVEIEAKLDKLVKLCSNMIDAGKAYIITNKQFVGGVRDLSQQCKKDEMISECLDKFGDSLQEMVNYHMILFDQAQRSVQQQLHNFVKDDVRKFKETKKQFDKVREDMEIALVKNAQAPRHKPHEVEEATGTLTITRKCFRHLALDYVLQINVLQAKKKFEVLDAMLSFMHAQYTFFQQGYSLLHELDPYMKKLATELDQLVIDSAVEKREMEHKHALIQQRVSPPGSRSWHWSYMYIYVYIYIYIHFHFTYTLPFFLLRGIHSGLQSPPPILSSQQQPCEVGSAEGL